MKAVRYAMLQPDPRHGPLFQICPVQYHQTALSPTYVTVICHHAQQPAVLLHARHPTRKRLCIAYPARPRAVPRVLRFWYDHELLAEASVPGPPLLCLAGGEVDADVAQGRA